jgi:hypothetical protein
MFNIIWSANSLMVDFIIAEILVRIKYPECSHRQHFADITMESQNLRIFFDIIEKESIKFLSLALGVQHCTKKRCIITYHCEIADLGPDDSVCPNAGEQS